MEIELHDSEVDGFRLTSQILALRFKDLNNSAWILPQ